MGQIAEGVATPAHDASSQRRALVFIGFMGAGKSTAARLAAEALGARAIDSDALLEERFGHSVAREFATAGESSFRAAEEEVVCELLACASSSSVIALGGGSILSEKVREETERHTTVLLDIDSQTAWTRARKHQEGEEPQRPLASDPAAFEMLHRERAGLYRQLADAILPSNPRETLAQAIPALLRLTSAPAATKLLWASAASGSYPVFLGAGLLRSGFWPVEKTGRFAVSDEHVAPLYLGDLGELAGSVRIPAGERHKTLQSAELIWGEMVRAGMTRADQLIALGGGVVGDLAGFCAATYQRGVPVVQVPTSLVAQVNSAYGGKTGVDLPEAKNYVGAYHQPAGVLVDPSLLDTLPVAEHNAGYAEVLKTGLLAGGGLWERIAAGQAVDQRMILECAHTKLAIVAADERDTGARQALNLGHTVAHAIEAVTGYRRLRHGEAVALGLLAALRLSGLEDLRAQVKELLDGHHLPVTIDGIDPREVIDKIRLDKKRTGQHVPFVLLQGPGEVRVGCEVGPQELQAAVGELIDG